MERAGRSECLLGDRDEKETMADVMTRSRPGHLLAAGGQKGVWPVAVRSWSSTDQLLAAPRHAREAVRDEGVELMEDWTGYSRGKGQPC